MNSNSTPISVTSDDVDHFRRSLSQLQTPSALERVQDWMGINAKGALEPKVVNHQNSNTFGTFFRCDYKVNKTEPLEKTDDANLTSVFNKSVPLCESPFSIDSKSSHKTQDISDQQNLKPGNIECQLNKNSIRIVAPSSVEIKKKELCSYLKLMNRDVKKEVFPSRYRRSTRVQNLEKKKQIVTNHKCFDEVFSEKSIRTNKTKLSDVLETFALQSFEDLNMIVDTSKYPLLQENIEKKIFNFVMPPSNVLREFNDFKHWVKPFVDHPIRQNGKINVKNGEKLVETLKREKLDVEISENERINKRSRELKRARKRMKKKEESSVDESVENIQIEINDKIEMNTKECTENEIINDSSSKPSSGSKFIILLHDDTIVNGFDKNIEQNSPKVVQEDDVIEECENVKIRIDYESKQYVDGIKDKLIIVDDEVQMPYFEGFSDAMIEESAGLASILNYLSSCINHVPDKTENKKYIPHDTSIKQKNNVVYSSSPIKPNSISFDAENEEIKSNHSSSSDSYSSVHSEDSSSSDSSLISENTSANKQPTPNFDRISPSQITPRTIEVKPFTEKTEVQSLHNLLKRQVKTVPSSVMLNSLNDWDSDNSINGKQKYSAGKSNSHFISFSKENGTIQNAVYVDFYLILVQEFAVSMWNQTALGNVLGAQNLWIFNGDTKKLILNKECTRKKSLEMTVSIENCVAYVELWTKEHKSDIRQGPVADIFAIVYFWLQKLNKMDKKVHQLENINGFSDDVQYVVLKSSLDIIVSWHSVIEDVKITQVHVYTLADDFQKIVNVRAMSKVEHYVSSLHNIEDSEELLMGCGEHVITLWNIEHGYIVASIKLNDIKLSLSTLWTKCDRGILFTVQQCVDKELRLIAINGRSHSWKKLKSYKPPKGFERIQNVYIENGVLISFYEEGILCWKAQSAEQILEENHETDMKYFPSGKYVIMTTEKNVFIRHALTHLLTAD